MKLSLPKNLPSLKLLIPLVLIALPFTLYVIPVTLFNSYISSSAKKLIKLESRGALSQKNGYVWSEIQANRRMARIGDSATPELFLDTTKTTRKGLYSFPSLAAVGILNKMDSLSNRILVTDRNGITLGEIKTTQNILSLDEFPELLTNTLILTEDQRYFKRKKAYEPSAFYRAAVLSVLRSITSFKKVSPRGTSTIHQQVARFLLSSFDDQGQIYIERSLGRKFREIKLAEALKRSYSNEEILEIYMNHCVTAGQSMVGFNDICRGLFQKSPADLSDAEALYLARLVKWNRQQPEKIKTQVRVSLPRIADANKWSLTKVKAVRDSLDSLTFNRPPVINTEHSHLLDLANEQWIRSCRLSGMKGVQLKDMDFSNPNSLIRQKGNLTIQLTIDIRLQELLEEQVQARGFGGDTTINSDVRIGSVGESVTGNTTLPEDILRNVTIIDTTTVFSEPNNAVITTLEAGDTLITNVRHKWETKGVLRRSTFYYKRAPMKMAGQYYTYVMIDSRTGQLLAYYSRDKLGSRLGSLLRNRVPNGSSLAKPMTYALNYDTENLASYAMTSDSFEISDSVDWARSFLLEEGDTVGMTYHNALDSTGYPVRNHSRNFEGYDYFFNHLARSNNIVTVEALYRLNTLLGSEDSKDREQKCMALLDRLGVKEDFLKERRSHLTGPRLYSEIVKLVYSDINGEREENFVSNANYSYALGTLELSVYEQAHLFNSFYNNKVIEKPAMHPSLVIKRIALAGAPFTIDDSLSTVTLFEDINRIEPVKLALFKRFTSNGADNMWPYQPCAIEGDRRNGVQPQQYPLVNYAKSGTTDDIIRPYNSDPALKESTCYGIWNGTFRIRLEKEDIADRLPKNSRVPQSLPLDVTVSCVGEANFVNTGTPDGKTLHKYLTIALMQKYGEKGCSPGYYNALEEQIIENTPRKVRFFEFGDELDEQGFFTRLFQRDPVASSAMHFKKKRRGIKIDKQTLRTLEEFAPEIGTEMPAYIGFLQGVENARTKKEALVQLDALLLIEVENRIIAEELVKAEKALRESVEGL